MTLTAIYEDVLVEKKGLSNGQITGIVIGSVAVAGIGVISIFWFAVKKKKRYSFFTRRIVSLMVKPKAH